MRRDQLQKGDQDQGNKTVFLRHLYIQMLILPRQARDKHRESLQKKDRFFLQGSANDAFRKGDFAKAGELYKQALELAGTVAYTRQFGGLRACDACIAAAGDDEEIRCSHGVQATDSADAVGLWTTLLSNRAECWLRLGEPVGGGGGGGGKQQVVAVNSGARAAAVDVGSKYGALGADPGHVKSRSRRGKSRIRWCLMDNPSDRLTDRRSFALFCFVSFRFAFLVYRSCGHRPQGGGRAYRQVPGVRARGAAPHGGN